MIKLEFETVEELLDFCEQVVFHEPSKTKVEMLALRNANSSLIGRTSKLRDILKITQ